MKSFITTMFILGFSSLAYAADGVIGKLHPPGNNGTCHGHVQVIDNNGISFTSRTPLANELSVKTGDAVTFETKGKGRKAIDVTPAFGEAYFCYLSAEEFDELSLMGLQPCEITPGIELSDAIKHAIRNAARKLGDDNGGSSAQIIITKI